MRRENGVHVVRVIKGTIQSNPILFALIVVKLVLERHQSRARHILDESLEAQSCRNPSLIGRVELASFGSPLVRHPQLSGFQSIVHELHRKIMRLTSTLYTRRVLQIERRARFVVSPL